MGSLRADLEIFFTEMKKVTKLSLIQEALNSE